MPKSLTRDTNIPVTHTTEEINGGLQTAKQYSFLRPSTDPGHMGRYQRFVPSRPRLWFRHKWSVSFAAMVLLPTMIVGIYLCFFATRQYMVEYRVAVRSPDSIKSSILPALFGLGNASQTIQDSNAVVQYLQSRQAITDLAQIYDVHKVFSRDSIDWWARLNDEQGIEDFVRYWQHMVDANFETTTGTIIVRARAFTPQEALDIAQGTLKLSEHLVNQMSERARNDTVAYAEQEVKKSEERSTAITLQMQQLRDRDQILDPRKAAETVSALSSKLRDEIIVTKTNLATMRENLNESAPSVVITKQRLVALEDQLTALRAEATNTGRANETALSGLIGGFEAIESQKSFADKAYQSALATLEQARIEALRQQVYLTTIVKPALPEKVNFPKPLLNISTVFAILLALWLVGVLLYKGVEEHL